MNIKRSHLSCRLFIATTLCFCAVAWTNPLSGQTVRGHAVDSVSGAPLEGALILLFGSDSLEVARAITDASGGFSIAGVEAGRYRLHAQYALYRNTTFPEFEVSTGQTLAYRLVMPRLSDLSTVPTNQLEELADQLCPDVPQNEPVIMGWVRHSRTRAPAPDAAVIVSWSTVPDALRERIGVGAFTGSARVDSSGFYAICGAPFGSTVELHSMDTRGLSNFHTLRFVRGGVVTDEQFHRMRGHAWQQDFTIFGEQERSAELVGVVSDSLNGVTLQGAEVILVGTPISAETNSTGVFRMRRLPSGPATLRIRRLGFEVLEHQITLPTQRLVEIPPGVLELRPTATELNPVVVEVAPARNPLAEFNLRREKGMGSFLTREEFIRRGEPTQVTDVLRNMHGIRVFRSGDFNHRWGITMQRGGPRGFGNAAGSGMGCPPLIYLDRHFLGNANDLDIDTAVPVMDLEAIEAYGSVATLPSAFNRSGAQCGIIAFWTRHAEPRAAPIEGESPSILTSLGFQLGVMAVAATVIVVVLGKAIHF